MKRLFYVIFHKSDRLGLEWLLICLLSLRKYSDAEIIIVTDNLPSNNQAWLESRVGVCVKDISSTNWTGRRMLCKLEQLHKLLVEYADCGTCEVIMSDADVVFRGDPYGAFHEYPEFDVGYTTRFYPYPSPVNGGLVFYRNSESVRSFVGECCEQVSQPSWTPYIECKNPNNADWNCDQDLLNAVNRNPAFFHERFKFVTKDVGYKYNYCPASDVFGTAAAATLLKWAFIERVYPVIHFKGNAKDLLHEPGFGGLLRCQ